MQSGHLMRPRKDGDLEAGPFVEPEFFEAILCEMARVAVQVGEVLDRFFPETWVRVLPARAAFSEARRGARVEAMDEGRVTVQSSRSRSPSRRCARW